MQDSSLELIAETREILEGAGAREIRVEHGSAGYLVSARFAGQQHVGHTGIDPNTSNDPRDMARRLMAIALSAIDSSGEDERRLAPVEDEDPGEQDLGAEMLAAEVEAGENPAHELQADPEPLREEATPAPEGVGVDGDGGNGLYPGIAILPNVLADARDKAKVLISDAMVARLDVLNDPTLIQNAQAAFSAYNNYPAGSLIPDDIAQAYQRYVLDPATQQKNIFDHARMLLDAANRATEVDALQAIINDLDQRWPT